MSRSKLTVAALGAAAALVGGAGPAPADVQGGAPPVVVAVVGEQGANLLHTDFALTGSARAVPPGLPVAETVRLPTKGSFEERLATARKGPLGNLRPGQLYRVAGTRIVGVYAPQRLELGPRTPTVDILANRVHGTEVLGAVGGARHGTDPDVWLVLVPSTGREAWEWVTAQPWIDFISTSYISLHGGAVVGGNQAPDPTAVVCPDAAAIRSFTASGRVVFSSAGNGETVGLVLTPSGHPDAYHVGGVDSTGRTWRPGQPDSDPFYTATTPNRPYDTGELYRFDSTDPQSLNGSAPFGGTSGAAPRTAGDAALVLQHARALLDSDYVGARDGALARLGPNGRRPARGPLSDGTFTRDELVSVLRHTAVPAEPPSPTRYFVEGYGAVTPASVRTALRVLGGEVLEPQRPEEDRAHTATTAARRTASPASYC